MLFRSSFGGIPERLAVPFAAITGFVDPSVQFGLKFETLAETDEASAESPAPRPPAEHKQTRTTPAVAVVPKAANPPTETPSDDGPDKPAGGGEVVQLDRFRKK